MICPIIVVMNIGVKAVYRVAGSPDRNDSIPMLSLDGDALDRRNSHDGQIKTRLEAFLEVLNNDSLHV